jgi:tetratricopeptide (TPR) repeat protein
MGKKLVALLFLGLTVLLSATIILAQNLPAGKIVNIKGNVEIISIKSQYWRPARVNETLWAGDAVKTGLDGKAAIVLSDETLLQLNKNTQFLIKEAAPTAGWYKGKKDILSGSHTSSTSNYRLEKGEAWIRNKNKEIIINFQTPTISGTLRGTELNLRIGADDTVLLTVLEGRVEAKNKFGVFEIKANEQLIAKAGLTPRKTVLLSPADSVQWTISIPLVIRHKDLPLADRERAALLQEKDKLETLLTDGDIENSEKMLVAFSSKYPESVIGSSLTAIFQLMRGDKGKALKTVDQTAALFPQSAFALLIQSYIYQSHFKLKEAFLILKKANELDKENVQILVNMAKLLFGMDHIDEAEKVIRLGQPLAPQDGDLQNVLGFLLLAQGKTDEAVSTFQQAISLVPSLGEPHLGLALAYMRLGKTEEALEEISAAILLEPRRSIFLSYWAKMLYQLQRFDQALDVLKMASQFDPQDPTPELYRAIILRDLNRPTESIKAYNQAIDLNDNRAVNRSRFLLDRDLAVKNIDLSILYDKLGLSAWARNKALASIKQDFINPAGHLFMGGALYQMGGLSWPFSGEYLLARLLQPANQNTFNSFNDYTTFFEQPTINGTISGLLGNKNTAGGSLTAFGAVPNVGLAFGTALSYAKTDGWRDINYEKTSNQVGMVKLDITPKDNLLLVLSKSVFEQGDSLSRRFEASSSTRPKDTFENPLTRYEVGYHRNFAPGSDLMVYLAHLNSRAWASSEILPAIMLNLDNYLPYYQAQAQHLYKITNHQFIIGTFQYWGDNSATVKVPAIRSTTKNDLYNQFQSYYIQDIWSLTPSLNLELAAYYDKVRNSQSITVGNPGTVWTLSEFNPRLGMAWTPVKGDTFRAAAFRTLLPFRCDRIDPMDSAGFPVYRNYSPGSLGTETDLAWDHEWKTGFLSTNLFYLDREYSHLDMVNNKSTLNRDRSIQKGFEANYNQLLWSGLGFNGIYRYTMIDDKNYSQGGWEDHRVIGGLKYLHVDGFSCSLTETYRYSNFNQQGRNNEQLWVTDLTLGIEFPGKKGLISLEFSNVFDRRFDWVTDPFNTTGKDPSREILLKISLNY